MNRPSVTPGTTSDSVRRFTRDGCSSFWRVAGSCSLLFGMTAAIAAGQVITIDKQGNATNGTSAPVDRRFAQIQPTKVPLDNSVMDAKTRQELIRVLQAEQGFAMRPFPRGHKGLMLVANGPLSPAGEDYLNLVTSQGLSAKPGDRLVLTDVKIDKDKIIFDLNGGPDAKHRFMRHVQIGAGGGTNTTPVVQDDGQQPTGARLTLDFKGHLPAVTGTQVKALLAPLISFDVKTPIEAFTDTLPPRLKEAILSHHVLVGMSTEMVLFAKGQPERKTRETEGQMPFEEWIYGRPPKDVEFIRINGNRVIRVEVAKMGEKPVIYTQDEVEGLMRTDGTPLTEEKAKHTAQIGDVQRDPDTQAPTAPPSLRKPGETVPDPHGSTPDRAGQMGPVQFPKQKPDDYPDASKLPRTHPAQTSDEDADSRPSATDTKKAASGSDASKQESGDSGQAQQDATKPH